MADRPYPYAPKDAGDIIRADDWNELQIKAREEIQSHQHTGDSDGALIPRAGIEPEAIDGSLIDPAAEVTLKTLHLSGELTVDGQAILADIDGLLTIFNDNVGIGVQEPDVKLHVGGDLKVTGTIYAGGNPVAYENYEIYLRGSALDSSEGNITFLKIANILMPMDNQRGLNTVILNPNGVFKNKASHDVFDNVLVWNDWADWINANATQDDLVAVASFNEISSAPRGGAAERLLNDIRTLQAFSAGKDNQRSSYALLFVMGYAAIERLNPYKGNNTHIKTTYYHLLSLDKATIAAIKSPLRHRMYPANPIIYQDIFVAREKEAIAKMGNPSYYNDSTYTSNNPWNGRTIMAFGGANENDGNGARVTIPEGYNTVWVRVQGNCWNVIKAYFIDGDQELVGVFVGGYRSANCYCPDGALTDSYQAIHQWLPIPAGRSGQLALISKTPTNNNFWLSGLAFSSNPWAHAAQSGVGYCWAVNGGEKIDLDSPSWNNDVLVRINPKTNLELKVPVLPSGQDKLLYLVEYNSTGNGCMHTGITVNQAPIERFIATYDNPFARHWNSKIYFRYIAARIPAELIGDDRFLSVRIDMSKQDAGIYFREMGTHDFETPWG